MKPTMENPLLAKVAVLESRILELEAALKPFASESDAWKDFLDSEPLVEGWSDGPDSTLAVRHLRAAALVMANA